HYICKRSQYLPLPRNGIEREPIDILRLHKTLYCLRLCLIEIPYNSTGIQGAKVETSIGKSISIYIDDKRRICLYILNCQTLSTSKLIRCCGISKAKMNLSYLISCNIPYFNIGE